MPSDTRIYKAGFRLEAQLGFLIVLKESFFDRDVFDPTPKTNQHAASV